MAPDCRHLVTKQNSDLHVFKTQIRMHTLDSQIIQNLLSCGVQYDFMVFLMKKQLKYFSNNSKTVFFMKPRTLTRLGTLGQLRHRSVATTQAANCGKIRSWSQVGFFV